MWLQVYNEKLFDLLSPTRGESLSIHASPQVCCAHSDMINPCLCVCVCVCVLPVSVPFTVSLSLSVVELTLCLLAPCRDMCQGTYVGNLTEKTVKTQAEIEQIMAMGDKNRSMAATKMNTDSSRSHLLLQLRVTGYNTISNTTTVGKLTLVDLAGSERVSKTEASGERLVEAAAINKSLSALAHVFKSLATNSPHIPYRNSKLTHVLQDSLGGDSKTCVFINVSPLQSNLQETHCTLAFGEGIRKIELGPATKHAGKAPKGRRPKKKPPPMAPGLSKRR